MIQMQAAIIIHYNHLPRIASRLPSNTNRLIKAYTEESLKPQAQANQDPHIDTGKLNASGKVTGGGNTVTLTFTGGAATGWTGEPRVYAAYHEYGTRFTGAYPFLTPAVSQTFPSGIASRATMLLDGIA